jgi:chemotaxis protein MotB
MSRNQKKKEKSAGGESGTGRWMLTYLDMVTLLFGVFVIMYAMSNISQENAERVGQSLREGFRGGFSIFGGPLTGGQTIIKDLKPPGTMKRSLYANIMKAAQKEIKSDRITTEEIDRGIRIGFVGDNFFEPRSTRLTHAMTRSLSKLVPILKNIKYPIVIEGYTDDLPVRRETEESGDSKDNWELAARRAIEILQYFEDQGVESSRMSIQSFGKYKPVDIELQHNRGSTPEYRALNRRVDIIIDTEKKNNILIR